MSNFTEPTKKTLSILALAGLRSYQASPEESYLNQKQKSHFESILLSWRDYLKQNLERGPRSLVDEKMNLPDPTDRASQEAALALELQNRDRELRLIQTIEKTIHRLRNDEFGYCHGCGEAIGLKRLEASPTADLCVDCKQLEEMHLRRSQQKYSMLKSSSQ